MNIRKRASIFKILIIGLLILSIGAAGELSAQLWERTLEKEKPTFEEIRKHYYKHLLKIGVKQPRGWKHFKRWEWFARTRLDAGGYFDPSLNWKGWLEKKNNFGSGSRPVNAGWRELGPVQIPERYNDYGYAGMGRLNCLAFHPKDPSIIWAGAPSGGLWKTTDGGATWTNLTDQLPNLGVTSIVIHPDNPNIIYIATGDGDGLDTFSIGVLKSMDGGASWNTTGINPMVSEKWAISKLLMHPTNPDIIVGAFSQGIYKTVDGGETWSQKTSGNIKDIEVDPSNPSIWYAAIRSVGVYKSTDSGNSWDLINSGLPDSGFGRIAIALSPSSSNVIYALYVNNVERGFHGLYRSVNGGQSWALRAVKPNLLGWDPRGKDTDGQGHYDLVLAVQPDNPDIVYAGGVNLWKSLNGGETWTLKAHWYGGGDAAFVHADHHALEFHPSDPLTLYSGNDGGLHRSTDGGTTWTDHSNGLAIHQVYRMGIASKNPEEVIVGNQDNGSDLRLDGAWKSIFGADGMECNFDPIDNTIMYCSIYLGDFFRSNDSGLNWNAISPPEVEGKGAWVTPFVIDPINPAVLYTATRKVFKSSDRGKTWSAISGDLASRNLTVLAVAPSDPKYIYASSYENGFAMTSDGGGNWKPLPASSRPTRVKAIAVHPTNPLTIWVALGGYVPGDKVKYSTDGGDTWTNVSGSLPNIPANCLAVVPGTADVYLGTDLGVFYAPAGTSAWQAFDTGLPNVIVNDLEIHPGDNKILAATYGRGVWVSTLAQPPAVFPPQNLNGERERNYSFFFREYVDSLTWDANPQNQDKQVVSYRIYKRVENTETLIDTVDGSSYSYFVRNVENSENLYCISAVNAEGEESAKTCVQVK